MNIFVFYTNYLFIDTYTGAYYTNGLLIIQKANIARIVPIRYIYIYEWCLESLYSNDDQNSY